MRRRSSWNAALENDDGPVHVGDRGIGFAFGGGMTALTSGGLFCRPQPRPVTAPIMVINPSPNRMAVRAGLEKHRKRRSQRPIPTWAGVLQLSAITRTAAARAEARTDRRGPCDAPATIDTLVAEIRSFTR